MLVYFEYEEAWHVAVRVNGSDPHGPFDEAQVEEHGRSIGGHDLQVLVDEHEKRVDAIGGQNHLERVPGGRVAVAVPRDHERVAYPEPGRDVAEVGVGDAIGELSQSGRVGLRAVHVRPDARVRPVEVVDAHSVRAQPEVAVAADRRRVDVRAGHAEPEAQRDVEAVHRRVRVAVVDRAGAAVRKQHFKAINER